MKTLKIALIATAVTCLLIVGCSFSCAETAVRPNLSDFYPETAVIVSLDYEADKVSCVTYKGHIFEFYGCFDWMIGDMVSLWMWDCGTCLDVTDDEILDVELVDNMPPQLVAIWMAH